MESSSSKIEAMKPFLYKAGVPLALSLAGFILARIATRKPRNHAVIQELNSCEMYQEEGTLSLEDDHTCALEKSSHAEESRGLEEEVMGLRRRIEDIKGREWQLEKRFLYYEELKDQEMVLVEILNKMMLEMNRVEFLGREVSLLEEESQRLERIAVDYLELLRLVEFFRSENGKLRKTVKKLVRKTKEHSWNFRKQRRLIHSREREVSRNKKELELKDDCIRLMENGNNELKLVIEVLQREKDELENKLREAVESAALKVEGETVSTENYNNLQLELDHSETKLKEVEEVTYLRRINAFLRHELMRKNQEQEQTEENTETDNNLVEIEELRSDSEVNQCNAKGDPYFRSTAPNRDHSRRRKLVAKLKRWVEGSERSDKQRVEEKEKHGIKCFPRHSVSDGGEEPFLPARRSCSSA